MDTKNRKAPRTNTEPYTGASIIPNSKKSTVNEQNLYSLEEFLASKKSMKFNALSHLWNFALTARTCDLGSFWTVENTTFKQYNILYKELQDFLKENLFAGTRIVKTVLYSMEDMRMWLLFSALELAERENYPQDKNTPALNKTMEI